MNDSIDDLLAQARREAHERVRRCHEVAGKVLELLKEYDYSTQADAIRSLCPLFYIWEQRPSGIGVHPSQFRPEFISLKETT